jgi:CheY-like chemotaxis protein
MADLAAHLVRSGVLPPAGAARALAAAYDGDVASSALRLGLVAEAALAKALADLHGCPAVDFSKSVVPTPNLEVVPPEFCREHRCLPVSISRSELVLAMADPEDYGLADEVRFVTGRTVLRYAAVPAAIERTLEALLRERSRGRTTWRGHQAPALPDPAAAWVGVVHGLARPDALELPEITATMELVGAAAGLEATPFSAPSPARRERPVELARLRAVPPPPGSSETARRIGGLGAGKLALVGDVTPEAREQVAALLAGLGCTVLQAANGRHALEIIREARPDLVVLDAMLPMMPGFEVCRAVKGDPVLRATAVVLTAGVHRRTVAADVKAAFGADAFLEKPYRDDEVLRTAKLLLAGPRDDPAEAAAREAARVAWKEGARLLQAGRADEASAYLREATAKDDFSAEAHYYLGLALAQQGLLFEAAAAFARAAELRPDVDAAHQVLARAHEQLGFLKSAREAWARAIETCRDEKRKADMQVRLMQLLGM